MDPRPIIHLIDAGNIRCILIGPHLETLNSHKVRVDKSGWLSNEVIG